MEDSAVDAGKSSIIYNLTRAVASPGLAATNSFVNQALKGVNQDHHMEMLEKYQAVTKAEVLGALRKYVLDVFNPATSIAISVSAPGKVASTVEGLKEIGFDVETREVHVEPEELESESGDESESGSGSESER